MHKISITRICKKVKNSTIKHSPEILIGLGIAGMITSTIMAVKATPKALILIEDENGISITKFLNRLKRTAFEECERVERLEPIDVIKVTWKCYIPAAVIGTVSAACLIGVSSVNLRRNAALATAYTLSESTLREYQKKVVETIGEKKEQTVRDAVAKETLEKEPVENKEVIITAKGDTLCFDIVYGAIF